MPAAAQLAEVERDQAALTNLCSSIAEAVPVRLGNSLLVMPAESLHFAIRDSFKAVLQRAAFVAQVSAGNPVLGPSVHLHLKQVECWCSTSAGPVRGQYVRSALHHIQQSLGSLLEKQYALNCS